MNLIQVWFTSNEIPPFDQEDRDVYRLLVENQMFPIGNIVDGRHLLRCLTSNFPAVKEFLMSHGKDPVMCGARDYQGNWIIEETQDVIILNRGFVYNPIEFEKHMQDVITLDELGNQVMTPAVDNTSAGWLSFRE